jgi:4-hydroxybenzoate polyprenyltransferase
LSSQLGTRDLEPGTRGAARWWVYQKERFPVLAHGPLILAFSFSAVSFSFLLRGGQGFPRPGAIVVAFVTSVVFFLQLRIADEFKDFEEDSRYRPYRAVPRGLVSLKELGIIFALGGLLQLGLALWLRPLALAGLLLVVWLYLALMSREFFVRDWIKARPFTYMWTHMLIMPLIDFYATACDWMPAGFARPPAGVFWFLIVSFFNGIVIEIGRKLRAPTDEETGVPTYTALWGQRRAVLAWLIALASTAVCAWQAARKIDFVIPVVGLLMLLLVVACWIARRFLKLPLTARAKLFESFSGLWTLLMYLSLGAVPLLLRGFGHR